MSTHLSQILLSAIKISEHNSSSPSDHVRYEDDTDETPNIALPLLACRSFLCSSLSPLIFERKAIALTNKKLPIILSKFSNTIRFIRSATVIFPSVLDAGLFTPELIPCLNNLRSFTFNLANQPKNTHVEQILNHSQVILEKLNLSGVTNSSLNSLGLLQNDENLNTLPSLTDLSLQVDGYFGKNHISSESIASTIRQIGSKLEKFALSDNLICYARNSTSLVNMNEVLVALCETANVHLKSIDLQFKDSPAISPSTFQLMSREAVNLEVLHIPGSDAICCKDSDSGEVLNTLEFLAPIVSSSSCCSVKDLKLADTLSSSRQDTLSCNFTSKFFTMIVPNLTKLSLVSGPFDRFFGTDNSSSAVVGGGHQSGGREYSLATVYAFAHNLRQLEVLKTSNFDAMCDAKFGLMHLAKNLEVVRFNPICGSLDATISYCCSPESRSKEYKLLGLTPPTNSCTNNEDIITLEYFQKLPPPGHHLKSLDIAVFSRDSSCCWLEEFAPNLEEFYFHSYGFKDGLYENVCNESNRKSLKRLHMDLEESPTPGIFEQVAKCQNLEVLIIETATQSQVSKEDAERCFGELRKCKKLRSFNLDSCELPDSLVYGLMN